MNFMMNPKTVLTVIAVLNAMHGILWIFFLPLPEMGEEAVLIGTTYGKIVGCLNLVINALTINHGIIKAEELGELATPLPVIIVWALITIWMLSAGLRKEQ